MEQTIKASKKEPETEVCFEPERLKSIRFLTAEELSRNGIESKKEEKAWIQVTLASKYGDNVLETVLFPGSDWILELNH